MRLGQRQGRTRTVLPWRWNQFIYRLHPNRVAIGFRLLARNLAIGLQVADAQARPALIREPHAFRATHVEGFGLFAHDAHTLTVAPMQPAIPDVWYLPWARLTAQIAA